MQADLPPQTKGNHVTCLLISTGQKYMLISKVLSLQPAIFSSGISWAKRNSFCREKVFDVHSSSSNMSYNNISARILSSHHTHGKKDLNKQFSLWKTHSHAREKSQIASQVNCKEDTKFIFTELSALHRHRWRREGRPGSRWHSLESNHSQKWSPTQPTWSFSSINNVTAWQLPKTLCWAGSRAQGCYKAVAAWK